MNYVELKTVVNTHIDISKKIYICNFLNCKEEKMKSTRISLVKNFLGKYIVTLWLDYEYGKFIEQKTFNDKNSAANYAWQLYNNLK